MPIIKVENLAKKYIIDHQRSGGYVALRDVLAERLQFWKREGRTDNSREEFWALKGINFEVERGERLGIIGRNGAGKSTILKLLSRITEPTTGRITIDGKVASLLEVGTGFHPELTGRENIYLNGAILGMNRAEIRRKFDEIVAFAEVEKFLDTPVKRFSSGMFVRLAFAVASHLEPEILVVDEVLAVGDAAFQKKCLGKMEDVSNREGRTVLFVSHDMGAIQKLCKKVIVLDKGTIAYAGEVHSAVNHYLQSAKWSNSSTRMEWEAKPGHSQPLGHVVKVKKLYICDAEGKKIDGAMLSSRSYQAAVEIELRSPDPNIILALAYYSLNGTLLFVNNLTDTKEIKIDRLVPGNYRFMTDIPTELFANGECYIEVLCVVHMAGWVLPIENETRLKIEFFRDKDPTTEIALNVQQTLMPAFKWSAQAID